MNTQERKRNLKGAHNHEWLTSTSANLNSVKEALARPLEPKFKENHSQL